MTTDTNWTEAARRQRPGAVRVDLAVLEHKLRLALAAVLARKVVAAQLEGGRAVGLLGASANFPAA